jgi:hypothetical protein
MACLMTNRQALMEMIVMLGPDFTLQDDQGRTALMFAVEARHSINPLRQLEPTVHYRCSRVPVTHRPLIPSCSPTV